MRLDQIDELKTTPKYRVFKVLRRVQSILQTKEDLEDQRETLLMIVNAAISWEWLLRDCTDTIWRTWLLFARYKCENFYLHLKTHYPPASGFMPNVKLTGRGPKDINNETEL